MLPSYVQMVNGATAFIGGVILLPGSVLNGLGQPIYGWMLDRFGGKFATLFREYTVPVTSVDHDDYGPADVRCLDYNFVYRLRNRSVDGIWK